MTEREDFESNNKNSFLAFIVSVILGVGVTLVSLLLLTVIFLLIYGMTKGYDISGISSGVWAFIFSALSGVVGGFFAGKKFKKRGIFVGIVTAIVGFLLFLGFGKLLDPEFVMTGKSYILAVLLLISTSVGAIIGVNTIK